MAGSAAAETLEAEHDRIARETQAVEDRLGHCTRLTCAARYPRVPEDQHQDEALSRASRATTANTSATQELAGWNVVVFVKLRRALSNLRTSTPAK
jgi:hypothetical protein